MLTLVKNKKLACLVNKSPNHEFTCVVFWSALLYRYFNEVNEIFSSNMARQLQYVSFKLITYSEDIFTSIILRIYFVGTSLRIHLISANAVCDQILFIETKC